MGVTSTKICTGLQPQTLEFQVSSTSICYCISPRQCVLDFDCVKKHAENKGLHKRKPYEAHYLLCS